MSYRDDHESIRAQEQALRHLTQAGQSLYDAQSLGTKTALAIYLRDPSFHSRRLLHENAPALCDQRFERRCYGVEVIYEITLLGQICLRVAAGHWSQGVAA